ncbi:uncharacterized protein LOC129005084 [Macrosteles quadrilineatus]|uniref:uncharacterized protein LOC128996856 n=1 Tax=Macrosteles quadrilineatus TaxID=74068 RepID=UPI0023E29BE8|nr:uncharacterized protein LOC128996856 [Macrosteles quadrilineatus]XP_054289851.1 uncharacterized protein LOC129005084 [Macrosteles quadrilineatus]
MATTQEGNSLERITVKIPQFWPADPKLWFAQVETQFSLARITSDETKFFYVCGNLDAKYAAEVRDILTKPPTEGKYEKLKTELIQRLSSSQEQKTRRLLEHEEMGDRKPSQFLRHLRALAGTVVPDSVMKTLWLSRLPSSTQAILATQRSSELDALAELADAVLEISPRHQVTEAAVPTYSPNSIEAMMERLTILMTSKMGEIVSTLQHDISSIKEDLWCNQNRRPTWSSSPVRRSRSRSKSTTRDDVCWYHKRFGNAATKCTRPCSFQANNSGNDLGSL